MTRLKDQIQEAVKSYALTVSQRQAGVYERLLESDLKYLLYGQESGVILLDQYVFDNIHARWTLKGSSPSTINSKRAAWRMVLDFHRVGKDIEIRGAKVKVAEQWWLHPDDHAKLHTWLVHEGRLELAFIIGMIISQGLRIEEALRLEPRHFKGDTMLVPGTKNDQSQASIPIFEDTTGFLTYLNEWHGTSNDPKAPYFTMSESQRIKQWNECRDFLGVRHVKSSTMKALRRTFAYSAIKAGMPTAVLQKVLRQKSITTTERYLTLFGSGLVEESRKYL